MLLGNFTALAMTISLVGLVVSVILGRKEIKETIGRSISRSSLIVALLIIIFFILFSITLVHPAEQLYFDENIYQGIALNIINHANAEWCQYGSAFFNSCFVSSIYHDPAGISFFLGIAFKLFGVGIQTAYASELFVGALAIFFFFVLASFLFEKKDGAIRATTTFALMP